MRYPLGGSYPWGAPDSEYRRRRELAAPTEHPAPEVPMRDATDAETPTGAARVAARARRCGFGVRVTYARGTVLTARGAPGAVVDSIAVRARHEDGRRAVAVWVRGATGAWKFDMAAVAPIRKVGSAELTKYIEGEQ